MNHDAYSAKPLRLSPFPESFLWGVATAAQQIEGGAAEGGRRPSIWDTFGHTPGLTHHGDTADIACDHYHRWREDFQLLGSIGVGAYRFSVSWARLQPGGEGDLNGEAVVFYRQQLEALKDAGIRPFVTLYHWDLPQALEDRGGWVSRETAYRFADFAGKTVRALEDLVGDWITINESWCVSFLGYGYGAHAPGHRSLTEAVAAAHHLNLAHGLAVTRIRDADPSARVGVTDIVTEAVPASDSVVDVAAAARLDAVNTRTFLDAHHRGEYPAPVRAALDCFGLAELIRPGDLVLAGTPTDFIGINHYQRVLVSHADGAGPFDAVERPAQPASTSFGWSVVPDSLGSVLKRVTDDYGPAPIYVTEHGASFHDYATPDGEVRDPERVDYLQRYLDSAGQSITDGVDFAGYFLWSLLDNFEWAEGYSKRFGIVHVDFATQTRTPKTSAHWYAGLIAAHTRRHHAAHADDSARLSPPPSITTPA